MMKALEATSIDLANAVADARMLAALLDSEREAHAETKRLLKELVKESFASGPALMAAWKAVAE